MLEERMVVLETVQQIQEWLVVQGVCCRIGVEQCACARPHGALEAIPAWTQSWCQAECPLVENMFGNVLIY